MADEAPSKTAWIGLAVLTGLNLLNYLDRYVVPAVEESIKTDLTLLDWQSGLLASAFLAVFVLLSPVFGALGDRKSRTGLIALGAVIWSVATAASGMAGNFTTLFIARMVVGIGEAAYGTIAPALLADYFPERMRGKVFAGFYAAIPVGSALGYGLGGFINSQWGWRAAFYLAGFPGLLLAAAAWRLPEPERQENEETEKESFWQTYAQLLKNRPYLLTIVGYTACTFGLGGMSFWMPAFFSRERGFSVTDAPIAMGAILLIGGFAGSLAGGLAGDDADNRTGRYLKLSGLVTLAAVPLTLGGLLASDRAWYLTCTLLAVVCLFAPTGPINALIVNLVPDRMRASAMALATVSIHLLGDASSPYLIGLVSGQMNSLKLALLMAPASFLVGGIVWILAARRKPDAT